MQIRAVQNYLGFEMIDPTILADACNLCMKSRVSSLAQHPWSLTNPIYLTSDRYWDLAVAVSNTMLSGPVGDSASFVGPGSDCQKRRVLELVII
jgi:hypothetical protein